MNTRLAQVLACVAAVVLIGGAAQLVGPINEGRRSLNMYGSGSPIANTPPQYALAIQALGAFRGLICDIAFIRAEQFKEEGRFFDAKQLADWICELQPRFPSVWEFNAWNMSWNISVTTFTPEERWNWVYNGAVLIRDKGIQYNPRAINLYRQLAWIFINKMSEPIDDMHMAYKANWAWRMHLLLGPPPAPKITIAPAGPGAASTQPSDNLRSAAEEIEKTRDKAEGRTTEERTPSAEVARFRATFEATRKASLEFIQAISDAPKSLDALYDRAPETRKMVADLRKLGVIISDDPLDESDYWRQEGLAFTFFDPYRTLNEPASLAGRLAKSQKPEVQEKRKAREEAIDQIVGVKAKNPAGAELVRFLQRKVLVEVYKMDPAQMAELVKVHGPVDWRSVDAMGLYWIRRGIIASAGTLTSFQNDTTNAARLIFYALRNLSLRNRIVFEPYPDPSKIYLSYMSLNLDQNFIESMHQAFVTYGPAIDPEGKAGGAGGTYRTAHINFLSEAIRLLYLSGYEGAAQHYYDYLQEHYSRNDDGSPNKALAMSLKDYVESNWWDTSQTPGPREAFSAIQAYLINAYDALADGDHERYERLVGKASEIHANFRKLHPNTTDPRFASNAMVDNRIDMLGEWLSQPAGSVQGVLHKVRLWANVEPILRQWVYDDLIDQFRAECDAADFEVTKAFPEPPGMDAFRQNPEYIRKRDERQKQTPTKTLPQEG